MILGFLGFLLFAVMVPLLVGEARDLAPSLARWLLRWGARHAGQLDQAGRFEEEWLADLERVPGKMTKLAHACTVLALGVPRLRAHYRRGPRRALLPGWAMDGSAEGLAEAAEIDAGLQRVAEMLVPRFADHCFIDLLHGDTLIRRVQRNADDWTPPPGTWAQVGEQIRYPEGHFCQRAMERLDTIVVADLSNAVASFPPPSAQSLAVSEQVGLTSVLAAPLCTHGALLGVISIATSNLTSRSQHLDAGDWNLIGTAASRVSAVIDGATTAGSVPGVGLAGAARPGLPMRATPVASPGERR
ncbi:MAG TPA: GAF domain-containing protein [Trebonia sp.]|nr:GAF domain-containing protein [Trebonia sp.]